MKLNLSIDYKTSWGQTLYVCGSIPELGDWDEAHCVEMQCTGVSTWQVSLNIDVRSSRIEYQFLIKQGSEIIAREWGNPHLLIGEQNKEFTVYDYWRDIPGQQFPYTSAFSESFFRHEYQDKTAFSDTALYVIKVRCLQVPRNHCLIMLGESDALGNWDAQRALVFSPIAYGEWQLAVDSAGVIAGAAYKFAIYNHDKQVIVDWEEGENRVFTPQQSDDGSILVQSFEYRSQALQWKATGVAIPVFSLRTNDSFGIGEFPDLKKMIDWAVLADQKVIQILPVNDTTNTHTYKDSYPYNAISIYALHPIYLGLSNYPLANSEAMNTCSEEIKRLNALPQVDYEQVCRCKTAYMDALFCEKGKEILSSADFNLFYTQNHEWLFPYACFSYLRDRYQTADMSYWQTYRAYNKAVLQSLVNDDALAKYAVEKAYFIQFLLHTQLADVRAYAHSCGVILKGDIPIGINRNSVEAWVEPHLFNLDTQTGAPPDDFSVNGQNWGFPTYNWDEMAKDNYRWWIRRFRKMADYFDAYRIDHILGFFRIWEIPVSSVQGMLGYFSPAKPLSADEINSFGVAFDETSMLTARVHEHNLAQLLGEFKDEVVGSFLLSAGDGYYTLRPEYDTQRKIEAFFVDRNDDKSIFVRDALYVFCNEVLFVRDKSDTQRFHPRISAQQSFAFSGMDSTQQMAYNQLYEDFFFHRHTQFWADEAMKKLPVLISSTQMLVCGEDLGMIPSCVPQVMDELQILSLEIERMPKQFGHMFGQLSAIPYMSVCASSTHDMNPIRAWWNEDAAVTQRYYNEVLWKQGMAPADCSTDLCKQIVANHLHSPAMLCILPLQDWLSLSDKLRNPDAHAERINVPADPNHYWRYRMHLSIEDLIEASDYNSEIASMVHGSNR